jgi:hypothetical protein
VANRASGRSDEVYRLRLTLRDLAPPIWRVIEVPGRITLVQLHRVIQTVVGWLDYHLHEYRIGEVRYGTPDTDFGDDDTVDERRKRLRDLVPVAGTRFEYAYDFGDGWEVDVEVEAIEPRRSRQRHPVLLDGARAAPPEDVGGPPGYEHFLEVIADPSHEEHEELMDWVGGEFDPEWLDVEGINEALEFEFGRTR